MVKKLSGKWIKKYTELEYLENILVNRQLHLGNPSDWTDKNDARLIEIYSAAISANKTRATCLTMAADRFHFWTVFGNTTRGVCLWFDREALIKDINADSSLKACAIDYLTPQMLSGIDLSKVPFAKRIQYQDEIEFRVLRDYYDVCAGQSDKFSFSPRSLARVYLNPWLSHREVVEQKVRIQSILVDDLSHVEIFQNRTIRNKGWIKAAKSVATGYLKH